MSSDRRKFIHVMGACFTGLAVGPGAFSKVSCSTAGCHEDDQILFIGDDIALADTEYKKVRGYLLWEIYYFLIIPYGADTSGINRFLPPKKPQPWNDIFPAVWWGNTAPQFMEGRNGNAYSSFADHWNYDDVSENIQIINVFTAGIHDGKKRPVLFRIHGGGFTNGNGIEQDGYQGENISRHSDVVFCSINHRLGPIGFTDLSAIGGERFAGSGNTGILDIIAALEWVHNNIAAFGGDPDNVTIMGQSGGEVKVCTVVAMPPAKGLIHKAVALSGNITKAIPRDFSEKLGAYILREAGLSPAQITMLQEMSWKDYLTIANRASDRLTRESGGSGMMRDNFGPVADEKAKQSAPVYMAWFGWKPPLFDNRMRAFHCLDICFWLYNTDLMLTHTGVGTRPRKLSKLMTDTLIQFLKTGNPNDAGLPEWTQHTSSNGETMILNDMCEVRNDPDRDTRIFLPPV